MPISFFEAPAFLQIALGGGYLGYLAAYYGIREHHKQIDIAFHTVSFGLVAIATFVLLAPHAPFVAAIAGSAVASVASGIVWRRYGANWARALYRHSRTSFADDDPSVFATVFRETGFDVSQANVVLDDGTELFCNDTSQFSDAPFRPIMLGIDGSVAIYATSVFRRTGNEVEEIVQENVRGGPSWGDNLTLIPPNRVRQVDLRYVRKA
ncbi:MAG: hypothetical protein JJ913_08080 [Rhizobiaceae bacterium]|nr:hypothetical protein [Rhizobiaceae bacterium]